eukprot:g7945.t1
MVSNKGVQEAIANVIGEGARFNIPSESMLLHEARIDPGATEETKTTFLQQKWTSYANLKNGIITTYLKTPNVVRHKMNMNTVTLYSPPTPDTFTGKIVIIATENPQYNTINAADAAAVLGHIVKVLTQHGANQFFDLQLP